MKIKEMEGKSVRGGCLSRFVWNYCYFWSCQHVYKHIFKKTRWNEMKLFVDIRVHTAKRLRKFEKKIKQ